jgi:RNA polymerase sigma factor (sigma-70 family)
MVATALTRTVLQLRQHVDSPADDELLRRFAQRRDEAAFADLVHRHGAMVQGVARRALSDHHAAEDVLQATFLLLARKANHIHWQQSVGPWLYAAAVRFSQKVARRRSRDPKSVGTVPAVAADAPPDRRLLWQEVRSVLDEELARLPDALRAPLVLCYLQGLTRDEAAPQLGWTLATLKRRLEKGREILRGRLARRGMSLAALAAVVAGEQSLSAATVSNVVNAVCSAEMSVPAATLLGGRAGRWQKRLAVTVLAVVGAGGVWFAGLEPPENPASPPAAVPAAAPRDPLPDGAVARLGTTRLRPGKLIEAMAFSPDGKQLAIWGRDWLRGETDRLIIADPATGREIRSVVLPPNLFISLRWLADGRGFALARTARNDYFLWNFTDLNSSLPVGDRASLNTHWNGDIVSAAVSPDGRWLAAGRNAGDGKDQPIELWDVRENARLADLPSRVLGRQSGYGLHVLFGADGERLFALCRRQESSNPVAGVIVPGQWADRARLVVYEIPGGKELAAFEVVPPTQSMTGSKPPLDCLALSPDGKTVIIGDETGVVHAYDWAAGKETRSFMAHPAGDQTKFEREGVNALAFSPDGQTLYTASRNNDFSIRDARTGRVRTAVRDEARGFGFSFALSADGAQLAVADGGITGRVRIRDPKTGQDRLSFAGHVGQVTDLRVLPDGTAVTAGVDNQLRWWDLETGRELKARPADVLMFARRWSALTADGVGLFDWHDQKLRYVDLATGNATTIVEKVTAPWNTIHGVSGTTVFITATDGKVRQWDAKTGAVRQTYDLPTAHRAGPPAMPYGVMSPDERRVALISTGVTQSGNMGYFNGSQLSLYDAKTGGLRKRWQTPDAVLECAEFSPDGRYLVVGGRTLSYTPPAKADEATLPIPARSGLILLDAETGEAIRTYEPAVKSANGFYDVPTVAVSPNSHLIAAVQHDNSIAVYELVTGGLCHMFRGHQSETTRMAFTADGRRLVSVSADMTGLVWDSSYPALAKPSVAGRDKLWADLAKPEWELAGPALAALAGTPDDFLALVHARLPAAAGPDFDPEALAKLVSQLSDPTFAARERASTALARQGREALPSLHDELSRATTAEQRRRLQAAIDTIARSPVPSERLRQVRVLALLVQQKSEGARAELKRLAAGHSAAALTRDAKAAVER